MGGLGKAGMAAMQACRNLLSVPPPWCPSHLERPLRPGTSPPISRHSVRWWGPSPTTLPTTHTQFHPRSPGLVGPCESLTGTCHGHNLPPVPTKPSPGPRCPAASHTPCSPDQPQGLGANFQAPSFPAVGLRTGLSSQADSSAATSEDARGWRGLEGRGGCRPATRGTAVLLLPSPTLTPS